MGSGQAGTGRPFPVRVVIDHRERGSEAARVLEATQGVSAEYAELKTGDYLVADRVLFERKTMADFAQSVMDGRLFQQAGRLARSSVAGVMVLEGGTADLAAVGLSREALQGALISVTIIFGLPVLRARDGQECARLILYTAGQIDRACRGLVGGSGYRPKGRRRQQLRVLQALPGIGPKRAVALLEAFGSVRAVVGAQREDLASVPGVGTGTAEKIEQVLREAPTKREETPLYDPSIANPASRYELRCSFLPFNRSPPQNTILS
ncbi:MAG TPA: ERCC4 domain-containing protein [Verrucomicrobiae bacterium]|nr:ERCC4 domain-containing protein [Verrucomicrobiae bacterium]